MLGGDRTGRDATRLMGRSNKLYSMASTQQSSRCHARNLNFLCRSSFTQSNFIALSALALSERRLSKIMTNRLAGACLLHASDRETTVIKIMPCDYVT